MNIACLAGCSSNTIRSDNPDNEADEDLEPEEVKEHTSFRGVDLDQWLGLFMQVSSQCKSLWLPTQALSFDLEIVPLSLSLSFSFP